MTRLLRGDKVVPIVTLDAKPMKTGFGTKLRPEFTIADWRELSDLQTPVTAPALEHVGKPVKPVTLREELNDELPPFDDDLSDLLDVR